MNERKIKFIRTVIIIAVLLYGICPDMFIGPFDDLMVLLTGVAAYWAMGFMLPQKSY